MVYALKYRVPFVSVRTLMEACPVLGVLLGPTDPRPGMAPTEISQATFCKNKFWFYKLANANYIVDSFDFTDYCMELLNWKAKITELSKWPDLSPARISLAEMMKQLNSTQGSDLARRPSAPRRRSSAVLSGAAAAAANSQIQVGQLVPAASNSTIWNK